MVVVMVVVMPAAKAAMIYWNELPCLGLGEDGDGRWVGWIKGQDGLR